MLHRCLKWPQVHRASAPAPPRWASTRALAAAALALVSAFAESGCDAIDSERKPYTPFRVASVQPEPEAPADSGVSPSKPKQAAPPAEPSFPRSAGLAPPRATRWRHAGQTLVAPEGLRFRLGLPWPTPSSSDFLAWLVPGADSPGIGELWLYEADQPPRAVTMAPAFVPSGPNCTHGTRLEQTGPRSVLLDVLADCGRSLLTGAPNRALTVLAPATSSPVIATIGASPPEPGEALELALESVDLDGDGRDDVSLQAALGAKGDQVSAQWRWLSRTAGLSRVTGFPEAGLLRQAQSLRSRSRKPGSQEEGLRAQILELRSLLALVCAEGGTGHVLDDPGSPLSCGSVRDVLDLLTRAELDLARSQEQPVRALAALERHSWYEFGSAQTELEAWVRARHKELGDSFSKRRVVKLVPLKARPRRSSGAGPTYSPLTFHADGSLLVLTPQGVVRAAPDGRYEYDASGEIDPWPTTVTAKDGRLLMQLSFSCTSSRVRYVATSSQGQPQPPVPLPIASPRPGACSSAGAFNPPAAAAVGWESQHPTLLVGATLLGKLPKQPPLGSAMSPNGAHVIAATPFGLAVWHENGKPSLWWFEDPALSQSLSHCVVSNNAQAAACMLGGRPHVVLPDPGSG